MNYELRLCRSVEMFILHLRLGRYLELLLRKCYRIFLVDLVRNELGIAFLFLVIVSVD